VSFVEEVLSGPTVSTAVYMCAIYTQMAIVDRLLRCTGFHWDEANAPKIWKKHEISAMECEQVFFNLPLVARHGEKHSGAEMHYFVLGQSDGGRRLFVVVTVREGHQKDLVWLPSTSQGPWRLSRIPQVHRAFGLRCWANLGLLHLPSSWRRFASAT